MSALNNTDIARSDRAGCTARPPTGRRARLQPIRRPSLICGNAVPHFSSRHIVAAERELPEPRHKEVAARGALDCVRCWNSLLKGGALDSLVKAPPASPSDRDRRNSRASALLAPPRISGFSSIAAASNARLRGRWLAVGLFGAIALAFWAVARSTTPISEDLCRLHYALFVRSALAARGKTGARTRGPTQLRWLMRHPSGVTIQP
jgi:hypothetical protein